MIVLDKCSKVYSKDKGGIKDVDLKLPTTGLIGILGSSGSGKSTLINCLGGLDEFTSGHLFIDDLEVKDLSLYSTYVFQEFKLLEQLTVWENIIFSIDTKDNYSKMTEILVKLGILDIRDSKVNEISGGQRQRVAIARALIKDVPILFCDEPTASLDGQTSREIFALLKEISKDKLVIIVSHHEMLKEYTRQLIKIEDGQIVECFNCEDKTKRDFQAVCETPLLNKSAFKLSWLNLLNNKIKALMTFVFMIISLTALSILITFLTINGDKIAYMTFKEQEQKYVSFYQDEKNSKNTFTDENMGKLNPQIIAYEEVNFKLKYQDKTKYINNVWAVQNGAYNDISLEKNEVIIAKSFALRLVDDANSLLYQSLNNVEGDLIIKGFLDESCGNTVVMTKEALQIFNGNLLEKSSVSVSIANEITPSYSLYNPYNEDPFNNGLKGGSLPVNPKEACLPLSLLKVLYPNQDPSTLIGKSILLRMSEGSYYSNKGAISTEEEFILTGFTEHNFIVPETELSYYSTNYGSSRITLGTCAAMCFDYSLNTFKIARNNGLVHAGELSDKIHQAIAIPQKFSGVLAVFTMVFTVISILTVLNGVSTSILKSKKDLGVLICFKIKQKTLGKIFIFESMMVTSVSVVASIGLYLYLVNVINTMIEREWHLNVMLLRFSFLVVLLLFAAAILIIVLATIVPLYRLVRKRPIDILYER